MKTIEISLEQKLIKIKSNLIYQISEKECKNVEFIRGQISLINELLTDKYIDKKVIVYTQNDPF